MDREQLDRLFFALMQHVPVTTLINCAEIGHAEPYGVGYRGPDESEAIVSSMLADIALGSGPTSDLGPPQFG